MKNQTNVALGLCALLLATERMEKIAGDCATDEVEIGSSTTRLLSHASSIRAACEAGQGLTRRGRLSERGRQRRESRCCESALKLDCEMVLDKLASA